MEEKARFSFRRLLQIPKKLQSRYLIFKFENECNLSIHDKPYTQCVERAAVDEYSYNGRI